ncbi:MAG: VIT1/CCC1 transporter family protein [Candidatus Aenigmarchaeota archaeon]|nr:VIT1/CCC1 transporter family protein [Candidatus Aenigmarchaeota archaeon]
MLGVILAVATAVSDVRVVLIAGLAATFAESISMAAVAYTSTKAARDFYKAELRREKREMKDIPDMERKEIRMIYARKGFSGALLNSIVKKITSNKRLWLKTMMEELWLKTMMEEELHLYPDEYNHPAKDAIIVGIAALIGSLVPLISFIFLPIQTAIIGSIVLSVAVLFITGYIKGMLTINPLRSGIEIAVIGITAALVGYVIGAVLGVALYAA